MTDVVIDDQSLARFRLLRPILEDEVSVRAGSRTSGVPPRTLRR